MPPGDFGYMEEGELGKAYNLSLLARLAGYLGKSKRILALAALLVLVTTLLELALPYVTRVGIDNYMVRQALALRLGKATPEQEQALKAQAAGNIIQGPHGGAYITEPDLRKVDQRLVAQLRRDGVVDESPYYLAPDNDTTKALAKQYPSLFIRADGRFLIRTADLERLPEESLRELRTPDAHGLAVLGLAFALLSFFGLAFEYGQSMILERAGQEMMYSLRQDLFGHVLSRSSAFFSKNPVGKLVTRITNDVQNINEMFRSTLVSLIKDVFMLLGIVAVMLALDATLALACLTLVPLIAVMAYVFARLAREAFRALQGHLGRINSWLSETLSGLAVVQLLRAEAAGSRRFRGMNQSYYEAGMKQVKVFAVFMPLAELFSALAVALIIWYGGGQVIQDRISLGTLVAFLSYMQMFFRPVRDLAEKYNILQAAMASGERIFNLLDDDAALPLPSEPVDPEPGPGRVVFENVSFGYDPAKPVVREVSFSIPPGQIWAVVGPTGAGKTSLTSLLMRLYDPQQGRVLVDGVDLKTMDRAAIARRVALVPQEVVLLAGTIADNVLLDRSQATEDDLQRALEVSGASTFVDQLPEGAQTQLGEGGRKLSAGQRQILSLARALAGRPKVLILDEATSSVDPASERLIQQALPRVMAGRTSLVVAHRLSTIRNADNILVMQNGRVVEQGRHDELAAAGGLYARLVRLEEMKDKETAG